jgi:hypothetical protein
MYYIISKIVVSGDIMDYVNVGYTSSQEESSNVEEAYYVPFCYWVESNLSDLVNNIISVSEYFTEGVKVFYSGMATSYLPEGIPEITFSQLGEL